MLLSLKEEEGATAKDVGSLQDLEKARNRFSPGAPRRKRSPDSTWIAAQWDPTPDLQNHKTTQQPQNTALQVLAEPGVGEKGCGLQTGHRAQNIPAVSHGRWSNLGLLNLTWPPGCYKGTCVKVRSEHIFCQA